MALKGIRKIVASGIAGGLVGIVAGCAMTEQDAQILSALGVMSQASPYTSPNERTAGAGLGILGQMSHDMNVAREGRSQVNVNVIKDSSGIYNPAPGYTWVDPTNQNDLRVMPVQSQNAPSTNKSDLRVISVQSQNRFFACNYWKDFNNNGAGEDEEFVGVKSRFSATEKIIFVASIEYCKKGSKVESRLFNQNGDLVHMDFIFNRGDFPFNKEGGVYRFITLEPEGGDYVKPGTWRSAHYINGKYVGGNEIEVTE